MKYKKNEDETDKQETIISFSCIIKQDMPQMYTSYFSKEIKREENSKFNFDNVKGKFFAFIEEILA